jgi:hypothetical protein
MPLAEGGTATKSGSPDAADARGASSDAPHPPASQSRSLLVDFIFLFSRCIAV